MGSGSYGRRPIRLDGGGRATAGMFDDPFYFDLMAAQNGLAFCQGAARIQTQPPSPGSVPRIARLMALAIRFEGLIWRR